MEIEEKENDFKKISKNIMHCYQEQMHEYFSRKESGSLTDSDVIIMVMNLTTGIATSIYYSLKQFLPAHTNIDFDFLRAKLCNNLVDSFDKIKEFNPKETIKAVNIDQLREIVEKGECIINFPDGTNHKVTKDDLLIKKEDAERILNDLKRKEEKNEK